MAERPKSDFDEEPTVPGKKPCPLPPDKMTVTYDGTTVSVPLAGGRYTLQWLARQWANGAHKEFEVRVGGTIIMSSSKVYLTPTECQSLYVKYGF